MKKSASQQSRAICFTVDQAQYQRIKDRCAQTSCRSLAEYLRRQTLGEPLTVNHRNASLDDLITELSLTRRQLSEALRAFEQSAQKVSEIHGHHQVAIWLAEHQKDRAVIVGLIDQIHQYCKKTALVWLQ